MAEYIEREALLKFVKNTVPCIDRMTTIECVVTSIKQAPAADVVSLAVFEQVKWERDTALQTLEEHGIGSGQMAKHGEWKEIDNVAIEHGMLTVKGTTWRCNVCGEARKTLTKPNMNYCPNCGAKMDAERKCEDA